MTLRLARVLPAALACLSLVAAAYGATACGSGGDDASVAPNLDEVPTATLPADLPEALIIGGGAILPGGGATYTIRAGDTLAGVASRLGITLEDLRAANPDIDPAALRAGQVINLPQLPENLPTQAPTDVPQTTPIAPEETAAPPEPTNTPEPPPTSTPSSLGQTYVVEAGDIPVTIAEKFGITLEALLAANPDIDPRGLQVGQVLIIPSPEPAPEGG